MRDLDDILATYKISTATYEKLKTKDWFQKAVDTAKIEWNSADNALFRTQIEAIYTLEKAMPFGYARAVDPKEPLNHVVDFLKLCADIGGVKKQPGQGQTSERFQITINLGADTKLEFEGSRSPISANPALAALPVPELDDREERV